MGEMMIGQNQIIAARKRNLMPTAVFIDAGYTVLQGKHDFQKVENQLALGLFPTVTLAPDEVGRRHDLRFLIGCKVHVNCKELNDDLLNLTDQIAKAGARHIIVWASSTEEILEYLDEKWTAYAG